MENLELIGRWLVILGVGLALAGGTIWVLSRFFGGSIPGTLRFQGAGVTCVIPILASILVSLALTVVLNLLLRWLNK